MRKYGTIKKELEYLRQVDQVVDEKGNEIPDFSNLTFESLTAELLLDCREILIHLRDGSDEDLWGDDMLALLEDEDDGPEDILPPPSVHGI